MPNFTKKKSSALYFDDSNKRAKMNSANSMKTKTISKPEPPKPIKIYERKPKKSSVSLSELDFTNKLSEIWPDQEEINCEPVKFEMSAALPMANKLFKSYDFNDFEVDEIEKALSCENKGEFDIKVKIILSIRKRTFYIYQLIYQF